MGQLVDELFDQLPNKYKHGVDKQIEENVPLIPPVLGRNNSLGSNSNAVQGVTSKAFTASSLGATAVSVASKANVALAAINLPAAAASAATLASAASPITLAAVSTAEKILQLRRYWKTEAHLHALVLIYFMALDDEGADKPSPELLDAIAFAVVQKNKKLSSAGIKGLVPGLVSIQRKYSHMVKLWRGSLAVDRHEAAAVLWEEYEGRNEYARRTVAELFRGNGRGLDELNSLAGIDPIKEDGLQRSDEDLPAGPNADPHAADYERLVDEPGDGEAEMSSGSAKTANVSFGQKVLSKLRRQKHTPLELTSDQADTLKEKRIAVIMMKLRSR